MQPFLPVRIACFISAEPCPATYITRMRENSIDRQTDIVNYRKKFIGHKKESKENKEGYKNMNDRLTDQSILYTGCSL